MQNKRNISYISHTHWDREWYRSSSEFKVRLYATVKKVVETLESDSQFQCFTFDGQYQMIEEVLEVDSSLEQRLKELVENGRVLIGPWYIQPDMNLVDGESIANNLRIGINSTIEKFGSVMNVLWNPDTFFQSGNTPFFVKQFNLDGVYAWRNFAEDNLEDFTFMWEGVNGDIVKAITFPLGYGYFRYLSTDCNEAMNSQVDWIKKMEQSYPNAANEIFLMGGSDHATIQENTPKILNEMSSLSANYNFIQSNPVRYLHECDFTNSTVFEHQPISYCGGRIHPGIGGSRMDIKQFNIHQQHIIAKILSPIVAITNTVDGYENSKMIDHIWKNLLKNQFHDSIYTSSPEKVNNEVFNRYKLNEQMIDELLYLCSRYIIKNTVAHDKQIDEYIVVYNTLPYRRTADVDVNVKSKHKFIKVVQKDKEIEYSYNQSDVDYESKDYSGLKSLAGKYQLDHDSGVEFGEKYEHTITLLNLDLEPMSYCVLKIDKSSGDVSTSKDFENNILKITDNNLIVNGIENFIKVENILDNGDSYNFSTNEGETSKQLDIKWREYKNKYVGSFKSDKQELYIEAIASNGKVKLNTKLNNKCENNTLSLVFDFDEKIKTNSNLHYANIDNNSFDQYKDVDWKAENFKEKPLPIYLFSKYLEVNKKWTIISNDVTQFYQNENEVKFTLLRSYGRMGELDIPYRPGRASGYVLDTPTSQQKKNFEFEFTIDFSKLSCTAINETLVKPVAKFIVPTINESTLKVTESTSALSINNKDVIFETFKTVDDKCYVLRISNPTDKNQSIEIVGNYRVYSSNLMEQKLDRIENKIIVGKNSATTIYLEME